MNVQFDDHRGSLTWTLPSEAADILADVPPVMRDKVLQSFSSNLGMLCAALLRSFGDEITGVTVNLLMQEMQELVGRR
jgi:hypothetical protein